MYFNYTQLRNYGTTYARHEDLRFIRIHKNLSFTQLRYYATVVSYLGLGFGSGVGLGFRLGLGSGLGLGSKIGFKYVN